MFDLPHLDALEAEDFLVSSCNQAAVDLVDAWPDWPAHAVVISGAAGSGKSHLVSVWRQRSGADAVAMAGPGELVYFVASREAAEAMEERFVPVDHAIVGLVDQVTLAEADR